MMTPRTMAKVTATCGGRGLLGGATGAHWASPAQLLPTLQLFSFKTEEPGTSSRPLQGLHGVGLTDGRADGRGLVSHLEKRRLKSREVG